MLETKLFKIDTRSIILLFLQVEYERFSNKPLA